MFGVKKRKAIQTWIGCIGSVIGTTIWWLFIRTANNVTRGIFNIVIYLGIGIVIIAGFRRITQRSSRGAKIFILIIASVGVLLGICSGISLLLSTLG